MHLKLCVSLYWATSHDLHPGDFFITCSCRLSCSVVLGCAHTRTTCLHIYNLWLYFLSSLEALSVHWKGQKQKKTVTWSHQWCFSTKQGTQNRKVTFQTTMKPHRSMRWYCKYDKIMTFLFSNTISILRFWEYSQSGEMLLTHWDMLSFIILYKNISVLLYSPHKKLCS